MTELFLSRIRLRRDAPVAALARLLVPDDADTRVAAAHRLVWSLFADDPGRTRDFLWREERPGRFMTLSTRPPSDAAGLFSTETKPFQPVLATGDRLRFALRANAVIARSAAPGQRGKRHDVVMDALRSAEPNADPAAARSAAVARAGTAWLRRQGEANGFGIETQAVAVDGYRRRQLPRDGGRPVVFGELELAGVLTIVQPDRFLLALAGGFGRARAFGCGLMLIRRCR